jgi:hypothetical protein
MCRSCTPGRALVNSNVRRPSSRCPSPPSRATIRSGFRGLLWREQAVTPDEIRAAPRRTAPSGPPRAGGGARCSAWLLPGEAVAKTTPPTGVLIDRGTTVAGDEVSGRLVGRHREMNPNLAISSHYCAHNIFGADYATASGRCNSEAGLDRAPADAWSSSRAGVCASAGARSHPCCTAPTLSPLGTGRCVTRAASAARRSARGHRTRRRWLDVRVAIRSAGTRSRACSARRCKRRPYE